MKLDAWPVEPPGFGMGPLSTRTRSRHPSLARWYARLLPTMPAPMMTARAASRALMEPMSRLCPCPSVCMQAAARRRGGRSGGPELVRRPAGGLLDRDLLVDQGEVDALALPDQPRGHVDRDRERV